VVGVDGDPVVPAVPVHDEAQGPRLPGPVLEEADVAEDVRGEPVGRSTRVVPQVDLQAEVAADVHLVGGGPLGVGDGVRPVPGEHLDEGDAGERAGHPVGGHPQAAVAVVGDGDGVVLVLGGGQGQGVCGGVLLEGDARDQAVGEGLDPEPDGHGRSVRHGRLSRPRMPAGIRGV